MAKPLGIGQFLEDVSKLENKKDKVAHLAANPHPVLLKILQYAYDPNIKWLLPKGKAPYKPTEFLDQENMLYSEARILYLFVEGGNPNLSATKRETLFINLLESLAPKDALLIASIKDKTLPYAGLNEDIIREAFPDLLPPKEKKTTKKKPKEEVTQDG